MTPLEQRFLLSLTARRLALPEREMVFDTERAWRFDFAWTEAMLAVEVEGGAFSAYNGGRSRHTDGAGYAQDCDKYNRAGELGWTVLRYTDAQIDSGDGAAQVERVLVARLGDAAYVQRERAQPAPRPRRRKREDVTIGHATATVVAQWRK